MRTVLIPLLTACGLGLAACAPTAGTGAEGVGQRQCFFINTAQDFSNDGDRSIVVHAGRGDAFELTPQGYCRDIEWANHISLRPFGGGSSLCVGDQANLVLRPLGGASETCMVRVTRSIPRETPETEAEA